MISKRRYHVSLLLFWIAMTLSAFFFENVALLTSNPLGGFRLPSYIVIFVLTIFTFIAYYISEHKKNGFKPSIFWMIASLAFVGLTLFRIWVAKDSYLVGSETVTISVNEKINYSLKMIIVGFVIYTVFALYRKQRFTNRTLLWFYYLYVISCFVFVGLSFILDKNTYLGLFNDTPISEYKDAHSIFTNSNFYGFALTMGILSLVMIQVYRYRWYNFILMSLLFIASLFSGCAAAIMLNIGVMVLYIFLISFSDIKKHFIKRMMYLLILALVLASIAVFVVLSEKIEALSFIKKLFEYLRWRFSDNSDLDFISRRGDVWNMAKTMMSRDDYNIFFGYGYGISTKIFYALSASMGETLSSPHNTFYQAMLSGGLTLTIAYYALNLYLLINIIYVIAKKEFKVGFAYLIALIVVILHGVVETTFFFSGNTKGILLTLLFYAPILSEVERLKKKGQGEIALLKEETPLDNKRVDHLLIGRTLSTILFALLISFASIFVSGQMYALKQIHNALYIIIFALATFLFVPYMWSLIYKSKKKALRVFDYIFVIIFVAGLTLGALVFSLINMREYYKVITLGVYVTSLFVISLLYFFIKRGKIKEYFHVLFKGIAKNYLLLIPFVVLSILMSIVISLTNEVSLLTMLMIPSINYIMFIGLYFLFEHQEKKEIDDYLSLTMIQKEVRDINRL